MPRANAIAAKIWRDSARIGFAFRSDRLSCVGLAKRLLAFEAEAAALIGETEPDFLRLASNLKELHASALDLSRSTSRQIASLQQKVSCHPLNFMDRDYPVRDQFHAIFFRNVMIYFDKSTQEAVINKLCRNLARGGYLFVGHSESLAGLNIPLVPVKTAISRKLPV